MPDALLPINEPPSETPAWVGTFLRRAERVYMTTLGRVILVVLLFCGCALAVASAIQGAQAVGLANSNVRTRI